MLQMRKAPRPQNSWRRQYYHYIRPGMERPPAFYTKDLFIVNSLYLLVVAEMTACQILDIQRSSRLDTWPMWPT